MYLPCSFLLLLIRLLLLLLRFTLPALRKPHTSFTILLGIIPGHFFDILYTLCSYSLIPTFSNLPDYPTQSQTAQRNIDTSKSYPAVPEKHSNTCSPHLADLPCSRSLSLCRS